MRFLLLCSLLAVTSCGAPKSSSFKYGETTRSDIVAEKGEPSSEEVLPTSDGKIMIYAEKDEKFQLKGEILVNAFKNPAGDEKLLLFWKHRFKNCQTIVKQLPHDIKLHTPPEHELACPAEGISVIYTEGSDSVSRVVEYEKK
jgi:hypothetical protein